jgi:hypothetical protein
MTAVHNRTVGADGLAILANLFVQLCTAVLLQEGHTFAMTAESTKYDDVVAELEKQGLTVRLHSRENNTWHIADGGLYSGYVASGDELVELKSANNLNIRGIKSLG